MGTERKSIFSRVLVPLDGTPAAEVALTQLGPVLRREGGEALLLRAAQLPFVPESGAALNCAHAFLRETADYLGGLARRLAGEGVSARVVAKDGSAHRAILSEARASGATMIAMTTRGRTGLGRWLMGSVTEQIVRESPIPVWVTRAPGRGLPGGAGDPLVLDRILVPLEAEEPPEESLSAAVEFARIFGARVLVLRLLEPSSGGGPERSSALAASLVGIRRRGLQVETLVERGEPASVIAAAARQREAGLVTLREPAPRGLAGWLRKGLAERVLRAVRVPLLVVPGT